MIVDKREERIVGTYRLISSDYSHQFYSQSEFDLNRFVRIPGTKLELSRACIQKSHRTGIVMNLLWRGIAQYLQESGAKYLFGCASVRTLSLHETACVYRHLSAIDGLSDDFTIRPIGEYPLAGFEAYVSGLNYDDKVKEIAKNLLPPLFQSYLRMGAKAYGQPAIDRDFRCVDFLTVLQVEKMQALYERKYMA